MHCIKDRTNSLITAQFRSESGIIPSIKLLSDRSNFSSFLESILVQNMSGISELKVMSLESNDISSFHLIRSIGMVPVRLLLDASKFAVFGDIFGCRVCITFNMNLCSNKIRQKIAIKIG